ncbi:MAG TPA: GNAT family N-acetyltransferase [Chitinophagales bacterium]|nr:GNAT family N-acetyltransferase [Chitinophagales bacterium]
MKLTGNKIQLRAIEPTDIDVLYSWENNTDYWNISNTVTPFSRQVLTQYIESAHLDIYTTKQLRLMIDELDNSLSTIPKKYRPIGCIDLFDFEYNHQRAGIGILIAEKHDRRKGYASEALEVLIDYCFELLNLHQLYCNVSVDNESSILLFKKHGFEITGVKKSWIREGNVFKDELLLQLIRK